jgi:hypothetical protein
MLLNWSAGIAARVSIFKKFHSRAVMPALQLKKANPVRFAFFTFGET